ncbi:hypothetical protein R3P38DRAFT_3523832 [Favolaschia claudopus]|uniref:Uncharacterized protein n=1 Tax=Favolaschia claudopus TaxID=2862362 RepID=A0AAW0E6Q4_9AGAR
MKYSHRRSIMHPEDNHSAPEEEDFTEENVDKNTDLVNQPVHQEPEIKRVFHPNSKRPPIFQSFRDYAQVTRPPLPNDAEPWQPFRSRLDFEVAEFCELNMLNGEATATLLRLIRRCISAPGEFTLETRRELNELWELASHKCTAFKKGSITVQYTKTEQKTLDTYIRPLWDWTLRIVQDAPLSSCLVWDAEKAYKFNGDSYTRFYHEPWTAEAFWAAQSGLPDHPAAKPLCYIVYADKAKLSSFGTQKAYSVVARLANVVVDIRNSTRFGGGQVVGHQPIVPDDPQMRDKTSFTQFKNIVWHEAMYQLLESIVEVSKVGFWMRCGDNVDRWLWPRVLILAADYEEASVMALIRGSGGLYPCPICFVPWNEQSNLSEKHPLRCADDTARIIEEARQMPTAKDKEEHLKQNGLRDVDNSFSKVRGTDSHKALSYDPLHADHNGMFDDHISPQIKERVEDLGRPAVVKIDNGMAAFPRWRNLNHFETVMNTSFNDGSKQEDIAKQMLFVAYRVLVDEAGLLLLQALRSYLAFCTSFAAEVHTDETISEGHREVEIFDTVMKKYIAACKDTPYEDKNWNFPKFHARQHAFDDIKSKGGRAKLWAIRDTYHQLTNFKDVTPQIVKHDHRRAVATFVREQIDAIDAELKEQEDPDDVEPTVLSNVDIGSKLKNLSFSALEQQMTNDNAFERFRIKFGDFISTFLPAFGYGLPGGKRLKFDGKDMIEPFQFLKVHYESLSSWRPATDFLRCNPKFNGQPRYDCVLVNTQDKPFFARLLYMFSCKVEGKSHPFALVLPLDAPTRVKRVDKLLRFHRVRAKARKESEFISVHSIIRGCVLVQDIEEPEEFVVFDVVDPDMSRRMKVLFPKDYQP